MVAQASGLLYSAALCRDSQTAVTLYNRALGRGRRGLLLSGLTGRSRALLSLQEVAQACSIQARSSGGTRTVALAEICGSEGRAGDFDCEFHPLQEHTRARWLGIAAAMQQGRPLPPVALIQIGDRYFVRDGHHRISVARALGRQAIEATVEIWQVAGPLPSAAIQRNAAHAWRRIAGAAT
jgi:hypothetical protein